MSAEETTEELKEKWAYTIEAIVKEGPVDVIMDKIIFCLDTLHPGTPGNGYRFTAQAESPRLNYGEIVFKKPLNGFDVWLDESLNVKSFFLRADSAPLKENKYLYDKLLFHILCDVIQAYIQEKHGLRAKNAFVESIQQKQKHRALAILHQPPKVRRPRKNPFESQVPLLLEALKGRHGRFYLTHIANDLAWQNEVGQSEDWRELAKDPSFRMAIIDYIFANRLLADNPFVKRKTLSALRRRLEDESKELDL